MDLDRESPGSPSGDIGLHDEPPRDPNRYRPEVKLAPESRLVRTIRIAVVSVLAFWIVAGVVIFITR